MILTIETVDDRPVVTVEDERGDLITTETLECWHLAFVYAAAELLKGDE
jgi:hypothetical protein